MAEEGCLLVCRWSVGEYGQEERRRCKAEDFPRLHNRRPLQRSGVSKSLQDHHRLKHLNDVLVFLYEQYHYSPKALRELRMLGEAFEEKVLKPTNLKYEGTERAEDAGRGTRGESPQADKLEEAKIGPLHLQCHKGTHCFTCVQINLHPCGIEPEPLV